MDPGIVLMSSRKWDSRYVKTSGDAMTGQLTFSGSGRVIKYEWMSAGAIRAAGASAASETVNTNGYIVISFADNLDRWCQANIKIPTDMDLSAESSICLGWSSPTTSATLVYDAYYNVTALNESTDAAGTSSTGQTATSSATANGLVITPTITIAGGTLGSDDVCIHYKFMRDGDNGSDTLNDVMELQGMALKYTANKLGEAV